MFERPKFSPEEIEVVDRLGAEWQKTIEALGGDLDKSKGLFERIVKEYKTGQGRAYHNIFHIDRMLSVVDRFSHLADDPDIVKAAAFGHDIIYNPGSDTNEAESAEMFAGFLAGLGIENDKIEEVKRLIMVTEKHKTTDDDKNGRLLIDADFDILGSSPEVYQRYTKGIYDEYVLSGQVSLANFKEGRINRYLNVWLENIAQNRLYLNPEIGEALNDQARENILREKEWLQTL